MLQSGQHQLRQNCHIAQLKRRIAKLVLEFQAGPSCRQRPHRGGSKKSKENISKETAEQQQDSELDHWSTAMGNLRVLLIDVAKLDLTGKVSTGEEEHAKVSPDVRNELPTNSGSGPGCTSDDNNSSINIASGSGRGRDRGRGSGSGSGSDSDSVFTSFRFFFFSVI